MPPNLVAQPYVLISDSPDKLAEHGPKEAPYNYAFNDSTQGLALTVSSYTRFSLRQLLRSVVRGLLPSFALQRTTTERASSETLHPTAYLDGLRGLAAFAVFLCHLSYTVFVITIGFGERQTHDNKHFLQLPYVRLLYSGPPMVAIFFIISGYALSLKPIMQMRSRSYEGLLNTLSSSVFRRGIRLFLPCFCSTFFVFIALRVGFYEYTRALYADKSLFRNVEETHIERKDSSGEQLLQWLIQMWEFVHAFDWHIFGGSTEYDRHLWTIPVEFRASMVLFLSHMSLAKLKSTLRLCSFVSLALWALRWGRWELMLFWAGAVFAECDLIRASRVTSTSELPQSSGTTMSASPLMMGFPRPLSTKVSSAFWTTNFVIALYLCSYPDERAETTPGFMMLSTWIPEWYTEKYRFWQCIGAVQLIWAVTNASFLQRLFTGPVVQYLGKISYPIYLMHGLVIHTLGWRFMASWWRIIGSESRWQWEAGFFVGAMFTIVAVIWAADIFWRAVDIPCVKFAKWVEKRCTVDASGSL